MVRPPGNLGSPRDWRLIGTATGLGCSVVSSLLMCIVGGIIIDRWLGTTPWLTLGGVLLGVAAAGYFLYELAVLDQSGQGLIRRRKNDGIERSAKPDEEER